MVLPDSGWSIAEAGHSANVEGRRGMRLRAWIAVGAVGAVLGTGAGVTGAAAQNGRVSTTVHVVFGAGPTAILNFNGGGLAMGDRIAGQGPLTDPVTGDRVGTAYFDCMIATHNLNDGGAYWCRHILDLQGGNI